MSQEYKVVTAATPKELGELLNSQSKQGWEFVAVTQQTQIVTQDRTSGEQTHHGQYTVVFKR